MSLIDVDQEQSNGNRNQFEDDRRHAALAAFNTLARMKDWVDRGHFKPVLEEPLVESPILYLTYHDER